MRLYYLFILFLFSNLVVPLTVKADEVNDLKARIEYLENLVDTLEIENKSLKDQLNQQELSKKESLPQKKQEKSLATLMGYEPKEKERAKKGRMSFNYYYDNRSFQNLTVNTSYKLPYDLSFYQLLTLSSPARTKLSNRFDLTKFFTELNLRRPINKEDELLSSMDWAVQHVDGTFVKGRTRLGARVRFKDLPGMVGSFFKDTLKMQRYNMTLYFYETDGDGIQFETSYKKVFSDGLFYLSGFNDHNIDDTGTWIISEHQLGVRLIDNFYYITELRYNTNNPRDEKWGVGMGLEYVVLF